MARCTSIEHQDIEDWQSSRSLPQCTTYMLDNEIGANVIFTFAKSKTTIKAHKFMLMSRSSVFFEMLKENIGKGSGEKLLEIDDIEPEVFQDFLRYLYSDTTMISVDKAIKLTYCAKKYGVTPLSTMCMAYLQRKVNKVTMSAILDHSVTYNDKGLQETCFNFLHKVKNLDILESHHVKVETLECVLDQEGLPIKGVDMVKFCLKWTEEECKGKGLNEFYKRRLLGNALQKVPFCSISLHEFTSLVEGKGLLNITEEKQVLEFISKPGKSKPPFPCWKKLELPTLVEAERGGEDSPNMVRKISTQMWKMGHFNDKVDLPELSWDCN